MKPLSPRNLYLALIHYPVKNKQGDTIAAAITSIDLHDIARAARTYGIAGFYVVTPLQDQQALAHKITAHWQDGVGSVYNPHRGKALDLIRIKTTLAGAVAEIAEITGRDTKLVATSAAKEEGRLAFPGFRQMLGQNEWTYILALGTAWGFTGPFMEEVDYVLAPIDGGTGYNHLSVRSAAAIILDRLFGR